MICSTSTTTATTAARRSSCIIIHNNPVQRRQPFVSLLFSCLLDNVTMIGNNPRTTTTTTTSSSSIRSRRRVSYCTLSYSSHSSSLLLLLPFKDEQRQRQRQRQRQQFLSYVQTYPVRNFSNERIIITTGLRKEQEQEQEQIQQEENVEENNNNNNKNNKNNKTSKHNLDYTGISNFIKSRISRGKLQYDPIQERLIKRLQRLQETLVGYTNVPIYEEYRKRQQEQQEKQQEQFNPTQQQTLKTKTSTTITSTSAAAAAGAAAPIKFGIYDTSIGIPATMFPSSKTMSIERDDGNMNVATTTTLTTTPTTPTTPTPTTTTPTATMKHSYEQKIVVPQIPRGLYIYGSVGTGKSMIMDAFYDTVPIVPTSRKRRYHFHEFLTMIHERVHTIKQKNSVTAIIISENNPIQRVGIEFAKDVSLLCLDEFHIIDIADAMIVSQLFTTLFHHGTVLVTTSNRSPNLLYEHGLNRSYYFEPFLSLLQKHCIVHEIHSTMDYRIPPTVGGGSSTSVVDLYDDDDDNNNNNNDHENTIDGQNQQQQQQLPNNTYQSMFFQIDSGGDPNKNNNTNTNKNTNAAHGIVTNHIVQSIRNGLECTSIELNCGYGRTLTIHNGDVHGIIAKCTFNELCNRCLASSDYRAIGKYFSILCIENIPIMKLLSSSSSSSNNSNNNNNNNNNSSNDTSSTRSSDSTVSCSTTGTTTNDHNKARRFITLIDELYEAKVALVCTTNVSNPFELFHDEVNTDINNKIKQNNNHKDNVPDNTSATSGTAGSSGVEEIITSSGTSVGAAASVRELSFAFQRAASRISEMTSPKWWYQYASRTKSNTTTTTTSTSTSTTIGNSSSTGTTTIVNEDKEEEDDSWCKDSNSNNNQNNNEKLIVLDEFKRPYR